ncbi:MAG: hypothetical protein IJF83_14645 [Methanobrevibacter sp.]|nr:hypothetical protein [Methanobrevibacter sp.]MBQ2654789.1 hypothetical protein [Methanobrevibacter sp.]
MKHGKIIGIILIVCLAITFLGVASAAEEVVNGEKFNIPDNYVKNEDNSYVKKTATGTDENAVYNCNNDFISIVVVVINKGIPNIPEDSGAVDKTINGVSGKYVENSTDTGNAKFIYVHDNRLVTIVKNPDSNVTFEDIVIKF